LTTYEYGSTEEVAETTDDAKLYLLSYGEANLLPENVLKFKYSWWLRSPDRYDDRAALVNGEPGYVNVPGNDVFGTFGVRPALKLNLSSVIFSSVNLSGGANATADGAGTSQNYFDYGVTRSPMTTVTYNADSGHMFRNATLRQDNCAAFQFHEYFTSQARGYHTLLSGFFACIR
jgi:hypothetical protein